MDLPVQLLHDVQWMVYQDYDVINESPIRVYASAFPYLPCQSPLFRLYSPTIAKELSVPMVVATAVCFATRTPALSVDSLLRYCCECDRVYVLIEDQRSTNSKGKYSVSFCTDRER